MDLRWLTASDDEFAAETARRPRMRRPRQAPWWWNVLLLAIEVPLAWLASALVVWGTGLVHNGAGVGDVVHWVAWFVVLVAGVVGLVVLLVRGERPRTLRPDEVRAVLTGEASGYPARPVRPKPLDSMITPRYSGIRVHPRFGTAPVHVDGVPDVEFGCVLRRWMVSRDWTYLTVRLPGALPHLLLDATANDGRRSDLPVVLRHRQRMSLEGDFDRHFRVWAPEDYGRDALYVLTPDVMAARVDHAAGWNVEMVDDRLVFSAPGAADWSRPAPWMQVEAVLGEVVPRVVRAASRYQDDRSLLEDGHADAIAAAGRRLVLRDRRKSRLRATWAGAVWMGVVCVSYSGPLAIAVVGSLSVLDH